MSNVLAHWVSGNQILGSLSSEEYERVVVLVERAILATDLALYFKHRDEFFKLVDTSSSSPSPSASDGSLQQHAAASPTGSISSLSSLWESERARLLLQSMLMTACDVSSSSKPWEVQKRVVDLVFSEFFEQGDLERAELHIEPSVRCPT